MLKIKPDFSPLDNLVDQIKNSGIFVTANLSYLSTEQSNDDDWEAVINDPEFKFIGPSLQSRWRVDNPIARGNMRKIRRQEIDIQVEFVYELVKRLNERGVPVLAGTDAGVEGLFPGKSLHLELHELVVAGLKPIDALKTATSIPGDFFKKYVPRSRKMGRIQKGFAADLVLLNADPSADINNTQKIEGTMSQGVWHTAESLDKLRLKEANN